MSPPAADSHVTYGHCARMHREARWLFVLLGGLLATFVALGIYAVGESHDAAAIAGQARQENAVDTAQATGEAKEFRDRVLSDLGEIKRDLRALRSAPSSTK